MNNNYTEESIHTIVCGIALLAVGAYPKHDWYGVLGCALIMFGCVVGVFGRSKK